MTVRPDSHTANSLRVLITDDDVSLRVLLAALCTRHGYHCDGANDGEDALAKLSESSYDLLLLDLMMPRLNGFELIRELEALESRPAVIVVTAAPATDALRSLLDSDVVQAIVPKPFDFDTLLDVMADTASLLHASRTK